MNPIISIIMGSKSDWGTMQKTADVLDKFGVAYDQTPVKGASTRLVSMPDNDRIWLSFGSQWAVDKASRLDLGVSYIVIKDSQVDNNQTAAGRGTVSGEYTGNIWVLGGQYSLAF